MDIAAAKSFDRLRDFSRYAQADVVGAARWILGVMEAAFARCDALVPIQELYRPPLTSEREAQIRDKLSAHLPMLLRAGGSLTVPLGEFGSESVKELGWTLPTSLPAPCVRGVVRVEPASEAHRAVMRDTTTPPGSRPLEKMITLQVAGIKRTLVCADDPLESLAADLSVFEGVYDVAVRAWPDRAGRLFVQETAPVMNLPGLMAGDFAQGRLYDNGDLAGPVVIRVNKDQQITLAADIQEQLRPFVGTGVALYGKRRIDLVSGRVSLEAIYPDYWILCRLTDPKDDANQLPQAPLPSFQKEGCLCIGGTPPWNWQGPNVRTHLLAPSTAAGMIRTTERRFVFGRALKTLPEWVQNPVPEVKRIARVIQVTERDTDSEAHWGTRLAPAAPVLQDVGALAHLTSAAALL